MKLYKIKYQDELLTLTDDVVFTEEDNMFTYLDCCDTKEKIEIEYVSDLKFVFEKDYDDYHAIQFWRDNTDKYYKVIVQEGIYNSTCLIAVMNKEEAQDDMSEMLCWTDDDMHAMFYAYDNETVDFVL